MNFSLNKKISLNNQISSGSRSSLLSDTVEFKLSENHETLSIAEKLKKKYNFLIPDTNTINKLSSTNGIGSTSFNGHLNNNSTNNNNINSKTSESDNDGIRRPKVIVANPNDVQLEWKQMRTVGAGLANMGNTCFMNSVLQCLSYIPPLVNYLLYSDEDQASKCKIISFCMTCELQKHIKRLYQNSGGVIKPVNIYQRLRSIAKHFQFGRQEDAHEFLRYVIEHMWKSCVQNHELTNPACKLDPASKETTVINNIFGGYMRSQITCSVCKEKSNTFDYFLDFILDIKNVSTLQKALERFVQPETLENENAYKCQRCKKKVTAKKRFSVQKAPNVATFQFKRFEYNRLFGGKITKHIAYPETLDLRPCMSETQGPPIIYKLNAVLVHLGATSNSGHYFCYVRSSNNTWYIMDDARVSQVSLQQVLSQQAYILIYIRKNTKPLAASAKLVEAKESFLESAKFKPAVIKAPLPAPKTPVMTSQIPAWKPAVIPSPSMPTIKVPAQSTPASANLSKPSSVTSLPSKPVVEPTPPVVNSLKPSTLESCKETASNFKKTTVTPVNGVKENTIDSFKPAPLVSPVVKKEPKSFNGLTLAPTNGTSSTLTVAIPESKPYVNGATVNGFQKCFASDNPKVMATTSWNVVDTCTHSPSIASNSSMNSVSSSTNWTVTPRVNGHKVNGSSDKADKKCVSNSHVSTAVNGSETATTTSLKNSALVIRNGNCNTSNGQDKVVWVEKTLDTGKTKDKAPCLSRPKPMKESKKITASSSSSSSSAASSESEEEIEWVEKTKETLEKQKTEDSSDLGKKMEAFAYGANYTNGFTSKAMVNGTDIKSMSLEGYGENVKSWDDGPNELDTVVAETKRKARSFDEEYNEELDRGKTKKVKRHKSDFHQNDYHNNRSSYGHSNGWHKNPFQSTYERHTFSSGNTNNNNNSYSSSKRHHHHFSNGANWSQSSNGNSKRRHWEFGSKNSQQQHRRKSIFCTN